MADRFTITRVRLRNYRSIAQCDVGLGPLTLLVGPNGSGKSNFLDALRFTAECLTYGLDFALRERGGFSEVVHRTSPLDRARRSIDVEVSFGFVGGTGRYAYRIDGDRRDYEVGREECVVHDSDRTASYTIEAGRVVDSNAPLLPAGEVFGRYDVQVGRPFRVNRSDMARGQTLVDAVRFQSATASGVLIVADADDDCAVRLADAFRQIAKPINVEVTVAVHEFEAWFLACVESLRSHPDVLPDASHLGDPEGLGAARRR